jgi:hypothetical protein
MRFSSRWGLGCPGAAIEYSLLKIIIDIMVCTDFKMLQVKVPIIFFGTPVFSARRDGRYLSEKNCLPGKLMWFCRPETGC